MSKAGDDASAADKGPVHEVAVFDVYQGEGLESGRIDIRLVGRLLGRRSGLDIISFIESTTPRREFGDELHQFTARLRTPHT